MFILVLEQLLNGIQFGFSLFLISAGLTLIFGIMGVLNLAHGTLYMLGGYLMSSIFSITNSYIATFVASIFALIVIGIIFERSLIRHLYNRSHLCQVLATFAIVLFVDDLVTFIWGSVPVSFDVPDFLMMQ